MFFSIAGSFDLFYVRESGEKIGCRGLITVGQEEVREVYAEGVKGSNYRILVVPQESESTQFTTMEKMGISHFQLWPRECILGLLEQSLEDLIADETHTDSKSGLITRNTQRVTQEKTKGLNGQSKLFWFLPFPLFVPVQAKGSFFMLNEGFEDEELQPFSLAL
jgi:hypothetical protein